MKKTILISAFVIFGFLVGLKQIKANTPIPPPPEMNSISVNPAGGTASVNTYCRPYQVNWSVDPLVTDAKITYKGSTDEGQIVWCTNCKTWGNSITARTLAGTSTAFRLYNNTNNALLGGPVTYTCTLAPAATVNPNCPMGPKGDLNCDNAVNNDDFVMFENYFGKAINTITVPEGKASPDLFKDSNPVIDTADYEILRQNYSTP